MANGVFHHNLHEVSTTIADLKTQLNGIQQRANEAGTTIPAEFRSCTDQFRVIIDTVKQEVVYAAYNTAKFVYNNILNHLVSDDVTHEQKVLKLRRFLEPGPSGIRANNRALASQTWQSVHTLKQLVEANERILGHYEFNTTAILNRFTTVLNGIGWFSGIFYQSVESYVKGWERQVLDRTLTPQGLEDDVVWIRAVIRQTEAF